MTLGWGIVGTGRIAELRGRAINSTKNVRLVAVADVDEARLGAFASKYGIKHAYSSLSSLLKNPEVDIVYIATPNNLHAEQTIMAAEAKKHVLCEKTMALTVSDCLAMIKACKSNSVKLGICFQRRLDPGSQFIRKVIKEGKLGDLLLAKIQSAYRLEKPRSLGTTGGESWRRIPELAGGGSMMGPGLHLIDILNFIFDRRVIEVSAFIDQKRGMAVVGPQDALDTILMKYEDDIYTIVVTSSILLNSRNEFIVYGTTGRVEEDEYSNPRKIRITSEEKEVSYNFSSGDEMRNVAESFTQSVEENSTWEGASGYDGLRAVEITQAIFESAETKKTIQVKYSD